MCFCFFVFGCGVGCWVCCGVGCGGFFWGCGHPLWRQPPEGGFFGGGWGGVVAGGGVAVWGVAVWGRGVVGWLGFVCWGW
ncbi:hypothetical protein, partial [Pseudomonas syringae group genomosp. 7]|uniref:hypothetical protein n=1 Tax=Pseudomonas syringae group genomosp. 7 TaxID=251699 RepID=UPI0037704AA8